MIQDIKNALKLRNDGRQGSAPVAKHHTSWMKPVNPDRVVHSPQRMTVYLAVLRRSGAWMGYREISEQAGHNFKSVRLSAPLFYRYCQLGAIERRDVPNPRGGLPIVEYRITENRKETR
jgi:hypothetical protein